MKRVSVIVIAIVIVMAMGWIGKVKAAEEGGWFYSLRIDTPTIVKGYTAETDDGMLRLGIMPESMEAESVIEFKNLSKYIAGLDLSYAPEWFTNFPENKEMISDVYEFNILNKESFHDKKPLILELGYIEETNQLKDLYFWNGTAGEWQELPSESLNGRNFVRSFIHLPYARLAIFADYNIMEVGSASWYKYKGCDCAASPDYPKDSLLRVTNLENEKSVIVKINDFGPDRAIHPDRAIDLDSVAFKKLANLWEGIIQRVKVEKLEIGN